MAASYTAAIARMAASYTAAIARMAASYMRNGDIPHFPENEECHY
ncbi:MAG: hypothetical protein OEN22_05160 [Gammaproteobacteria bacterium]|nr:hypothetical protein [Gammaproteobacteria bacterium]